MLFYGSLIIDYTRNYMNTKLTYRMDLLMEIISDLLFQGVNLFFVLVVFMHTASLGGWTEAQILFIYGYFMIPYGIFYCFFNLWGFAERYIVKGEMDRVLTRPAHNLVQIILENMDPPSLVGSLVGAVIMVLSWTQLGLVVHFWDIFIFAFLVMGSVLVYVGVYLFFTAITFFVDAPTGILPLIYNFQSYGRYPIKIYNRVIQIILTAILPFAFVGFYPAAYFLDPVHWANFAYITPLVGVVIFTGGLMFWNFGVKKYRGAGS
ncbi:MAG: ABC-2 family transporter protein [Paenibacillaceae bacterium]